MNHNESMFEMDRKIQELEHAMTANDEYLQKVEKLNAELLTALKTVSYLYNDVCRHHPKGGAMDKARAAIAKAEGRG